MTPPTLPKELVEMMASRGHRLHHWLWHEVRNSWLSYPEDTRQQIRDLGWEPPRPALNERRRPILDNNAGEDFLYMHRRMLVDASAILNQVQDPGYPRIRVWTVPPPPGDEEFPVPPAWFDPTAGMDAKDRRTGFETLQRLKSDIFYRKRMMFWQKLFTDHGFLRGVSLGELGTLIESTIHSSMHLRWASPPAGARPEPGPTQGHAIAEIWDDPRYNFLGDTYSSHVHPVFWSLHGWIDDRIEDWKIANGVWGNDFWKGTWVGPWPGAAPAPAPGPPAPPDASSPSPAPATPPAAGTPPGQDPPQPIPGSEPASPPPMSMPAMDPAPPPPMSMPAMDPAQPPPMDMPATDPAPQTPPPGHAMPGHSAASGTGAAAPPMSEHGHGDPAQLEAVVAIIGRCGIFHAGYAAALARIT